MQSIARRHHYVPRFYLRLFCDPKGRLFVVDAKERKSFGAPPERVAMEKDFNRVDIDGVEPDALEKGYAKFESEVAPALTRIINLGTFTVEEDRALILNFIALLYVRNPQKRDSINDFQEDVLKKTLELTYATEERWE